MLAGLRAHVRANLVAYVALFFALSGTGAYASHLVVRSSDIVNGSVRALDLKNGAANNAKIAAGAVSAGKIAANAVTGAKIAPGAVTPTDHAAIPHGRALQTGAQTFANLTQIQVNLDTLELGSNMTVAGNALVVGVPGVYFVSGMIDWSVNGTGGRSLEVTSNDISLGAGDVVQAVPATFGNTVHSVSALARFDAGDTIELYAVQSSGGNLNTAVVGGNGANLSAVWISP
jgi:hypothetical protein